MKRLILMLALLAFVPVARAAEMTGEQFASKLTETYGWTLEKGASPTFDCPNDLLPKQGGGMFGWACHHVSPEKPRALRVAIYWRLETVGSSAIQRFQYDAMAGGRGYELIGECNEEVVKAPEGSRAYIRDCEVSLGVGRRHVSFLHFRHSLPAEATSPTGQPLKRLVYTIVVQNMDFTDNATPPRMIREIYAGLRAAPPH